MNTMQRFLDDLKQALLHVFFPVECLHCGEEMACEPSLLCTTCASLLDYLDPTDRCPFCFEESATFIISSQNSVERDKARSKPRGMKIAEESHPLPCPTCERKERRLMEKAACFDYIGPIASLIKKTKYSNQPYLAKSLSPFLALQWTRLEWEKPDWILPIPLTWNHQLKRGYNQSALLAQELSTFLGVPVLSCLQRNGASYSQAKVSKELRLQLSSLSFHVKETAQLFGSSLLLIDDVMTTGSTLQAAAEALFPYSPKTVRALVLCKG